MRTKRHRDNGRTSLVGAQLVSSTDKIAFEQVGGHQVPKRVTLPMSDAVSPVWPALQTLDRNVGVVITAKSGGTHFIASLHSVLAQTHKPERIVIVDDGAKIGRLLKEFPGVEHLKLKSGEGGKAVLARNAGCRKLAGVPYICTIDGDGDYIPPEYLEKLLAAIETDCRAAAAFPKVQMFGKHTMLVDEQYDPDVIGRRNMATACSLVRTDALEQVGWWTNDRNALEDWATWRKMRGHGWRLVPGDTTYFWHRHADSFSTGTERNRWHTRLGQSFDLVTIAVPFSGRVRCLSRLLRAIDSQTHPHKGVRLLFLDASGSDDFGARLRRWLARCSYDLVSYERYDQAVDLGLEPDELADLPFHNYDRPHTGVINRRVAALWNRIGQLVRTDLVWCVEDDVIPPADCLARLLAGFDEKVDAVSGHYGLRGHARNVFNFESLNPPSILALPVGRGRKLAQMVCMGCVLLRRWIISDHAARSSGVDPYGSRWYDWNLWADAARQGANVLVDWSVKCRHMMLPTATLFHEHF